MDDESALRSVLSSLLKRIGYTTSETADGEEAIRVYSEAFEAGRPFDTVILDLTIPNGMGGVDTVKRLLEIHPEVKAIVSSGYSNDEAISNFKAHGFSAVLPKPYTFDVLAEVVKNTIGQR